MYQVFRSAAISSLLRVQLTTGDAIYQNLFASDSERGPRSHHGGTKNSQRAQPLVPIFYRYVRPKH